MRTIQVGFAVEVPDTITDDEVLGVMSNLISVGLADAADTAGDEELESKDEAEAAISLNIGPAELISPAKTEG